MRTNQDDTRFRISYTVSMLLTLVRIKEYRKLFKSEKKVELASEVSPRASAPRASSFQSPALRCDSPPRQDWQLVRDLIHPIIHRPRSSQETTSSSDAEAGLAPDGFRLPGEPFVYTSRPASLHSCKGD